MSEKIRTQEEIVRMRNIAVIVAKAVVRMAENKGLIKAAKKNDLPK